MVSQFRSLNVAWLRLSFLWQHDTPLGGHKVDISAEVCQVSWKQCQRDITKDAWQKHAVTTCRLAVLSWRRVNDLWGAVAQRLECRTLNRENPGSNPLAAVSKLAICSPHIAAVHSLITTWLQTEVAMWTNSLRAVIAAWLNASQRCQVGFGMNRPARGWSVKRFGQS